MDSSAAPTSRLDRITATDVDAFARGIVERFEETAATERSDEARLLAALADDYLAYRKAVHGG